MVCMECMEGGPFYSLDRSVPAIPLYGNISNRPLVDQNNLPAKTHLDGRWARFDRPMGLVGPTSPPLATALLWYNAWWGLVLIRRCRGFVGRFGLSSGSLLHVLRSTRSSTTLSAYSSCFLLIPDLCSGKHKSSKITVELG